MIPVCVVFDLDDTLFLERDYVISGFDAVGRWTRHRFGISDFACRANQAFQNGRRRDIFDAVLHDCGCQPTSEDIQSMVNVYRTHSPNISLLPDAAEFINRFQGVVRLALITDGPFASQRRKVRALGLQNTLEIIVFTDVMGQCYGKPHPRAFQLVQRRLGLSRFRYFYVGDNPKKDFDAPISLNWDTVRVRRPEGLYSSYESSGTSIADFEVKDLHELVTILQRARAFRKLHVVM